MSYELRGAIGPSGPIGDTGVRLGLGVVPLSATWSLLPLTDGCLKLLDSPGSDPVTGSLGLCHPGVALALADASVSAALAYVEIECWAGECDQGALVFENGAVSWATPLGPVRPDRFGRTPASEALWRIGVEAGEALDEFDALALGSRRHTGDWT